mmetsp:Transcript_14912/g.22772  ORF Transcript_14912/g.22772 Transcript_14912/m.22772 type:complete len:320 (+) Transcript_14912:130-1089(+)
MLFHLVIIVFSYCLGFSFSYRGDKTSITRPLRPPFPDGICGGKVVKIRHPSDKSFNMKEILLPKRSIEVWLPPGYSSSNEYPVLLAHDGQNVMTDASSWTGSSWRMMGALTRLHERNLLRTPLPIVVLLPSADGDLLPGARRRHLEYAASGPFAEAHANFVVERILPLVEDRFSTSSERYLIGSSMGGQASMQLLFRHPELFNGAACLSPWFDPTFVVSVASEVTALKGKRIYLDIGGDIGDNKVNTFDLLDHLTAENWWNPGYFWLDSQLQPGVQAMKVALNIAGANLKYHEEPGGRHNERAWANRIDLPIKHLFGKK